MTDAIDRSLHHPITPAGARRLNDWRQAEGIAAAHRAADKAELTIASQRRRGKAVLEELLPLLMGMIAQYQPWPPGGPNNPHENRELFDRYVLLAIKCAAAAAPYQDPRAVLIRDERRQEEIDYTLLSDEELAQWRALLIKATRGKTIEISP